MTQRVYAYYPGCTLQSTAKEYDVSARLVCNELGIELRELEDWTCCGASSAHSMSQLLGLALPARELQLAEEMGLPLVAPCAMCYFRLKIAAHDLVDETTLNTVREVLARDFRNAAEVVHLLEVVAEDKEIMLSKLKKSLAGMRVACYYGCLLVRPRAILDFDDEENPQMMDRLMEMLGAESIDWGFKTECCGASLPLSRPDIVLQLSHRILSQAKQMGADCIVVACPMCHSNLDSHQEEMKAKYKDGVGLPVLYFTQLLGLALGFSARQLLLDKHLTDPLPMLQSKGLA
jgi:heterodisulfide reductase subunit B